MPPTEPLDLSHKSGILDITYPPEGKIGGGSADLSSVAVTGRLPVVNIVLDDVANPAVQNPTTKDPITKEEYVSGKYTITDNNGGIIHSGGLKLRGRGNSTWGAAKKPWRINFNAKTAPLGMTASQKNWALLAMWYDRSQVGNALGLTMGKMMNDGLTWTPEYRFVELVLNGKYRGIYQLADLVRIESGRVPGDPVSGDIGSGVTGTWLMEITNKERPGNTIGVTPDPGFFTSVYNQWIIYDDPELPTTAQETYIQNYITTFETKLKAGDPTWKDYFDATSLVDWWLINEILNNGDTREFWSSCKIWKSKDGKLHMGPLWDHDISTGTTFSFDNIETGTLPTGWYLRDNTFWIRDAWGKDVYFRSLAKTRFQVLIDRLVQIGTIEKFVDTTINNLQRATRDDRDLWPAKYTAWTKFTANNADYRKRFLINRLNWIGGQLAAADTVGYPSDIYTANY